MAANITVIKLDHWDTDYSRPFYEMLCAYLMEDFGLRPGKEHLEQLYENIRTELDLSHIFVHLLLAWQLPVGFCISLLDTEDRPLCIRPGYGFIRDYYIRPSFRRQALGTAFFHQLCEYYRSLHAKGIYLLSSPDTFPFWTSLGFCCTDALHGGENECCVSLDFNPSL